MRKRVLALIMTIFMVITMLPAVSAADMEIVPGDNTGGDGKLGGVTMTKELVKKENSDEYEVDDDGYYTLRITVKGDTKQETEQPSADIILVVDNSASMNDTVTGNSVYCYSTNEGHRSWKNTQEN